MSTEEIFITRFRELCKNCQWSQSDIARKLNMTQSALSKQMNGKRKVSPDIIVKVAEIFHITTDYLLGKNDETDFIIPLEDEKGYVSLPPEVASSYASMDEKSRKIVNVMIVMMAERTDHQGNS